MLCRFQPVKLHQSAYARYFILIIAMTLVIWLLLTDTRKDSRETLLMEYQQVFQTAYDTAILEAQLRDNTLEQSTVEIDGVKVNLLNGYPTPRSMLALLGLPDCSVEQSDVAVCINEIKGGLELSISGKGTDTRIILYPTDMMPTDWWQGCMLIYSAPPTEPGSKTRYQIELFTDQC